MRIAIFKNGAVSICSSVRNDWRVALHEAHSELLFSLSSLQELPVSLFRVKGASLLPVLPRAPGSARCLRSLRHSLRYFRPAPSSLFATFARGIAFAFSLNFVLINHYKIIIFTFAVGFVQLATDVVDQLPDAKLKKRLDVNLGILECRYRTFH